MQSASMEYDAANRLVKYNGEAVQYDAEGNMTYGPLNGEMTAFTYDCRNRLVSAGNTSYSYDAENNRISLTVGNTKTEYLVENNSSDLSKILTSTVNGKTTLYLYGNGLLAQNDGDNGYLYYHFNNIGSTTAVTDSDGKLKYAFSYGTYGELLSGGTHGIMFLYNGQYGVVTDDNGLCYMRARYYNVDIKRFINQDVVEGSITNSPSLNKYAYCQGNPVSLLDPFGLSPMSQDEGKNLIRDILGFVPGDGSLADKQIQDCIKKFKEGNYWDAAQLLFGLLPMIGDVIGGTSIFGLKGTCIGGKLMYGFGMIGSLVNFGISLKNIYDVSSELSNKHIFLKQEWDQDSWMLLSDGIMDVGIALLSAVEFATSLDGYVNSTCFVAGTMVLTIEGSKAIEEIEAGDLVYSTNPETGESEYKEVVRAFRKESDVIIHIFVNG